MYIFICEWNVFLLKLLEDSSFSWSVMFSEVWSSWPFSNKAHVHCLDLILQIFSTDTSYLVLKDTSRIPSPFSRPLDVFASLEDLWPFQTPQTNMIYSVLLQNKPEDLSKLLEKKCGEKKSENCQTVQHVCCWNHRNTRLGTDRHTVFISCQKIPTTTTWGTISN